MLRVARSQSGPEVMPLTSSAEALCGDEPVVAQHRADQVVAQHLRSVRPDRDRGPSSGVGNDAQRVVGIGEVVVAEGGQAGVKNARGEHG